MTRIIPAQTAMLTRRSFLVSAAVAMALPAALPMPAFASGDPSRAGSRLDSLVPEIDPVLDLRNANTGESVKVRFFRGTGYDLEAVRQFNWFMRDWRQSKAEQMDVRLLWGLAAIRLSGLKAGNEGLIIVNSGYRTHATNDLLRRQGYGAAKKSLHLEAKAIDFKMPGAKVEDLAELARWLEIGGCGHYRGRFVHIDSGPARNWYG